MWSCFSSRSILVTSEENQVAPLDTRQSLKSLCLFIGYTETDHRADMGLIRELERHFDSVIVLTNVAAVEGTFNYMLLPNKGYDFGFVYQALKEIDLSDIGFLGVINNSQILLNGMTLDAFFQWCWGSSATCCGLTDSYEAPKGIAKSRSYHVQSSFLVFKGEAVQLLGRFFEELDFERFFLMKDPKKLRQAIIKECEIGLSQFMIAKGQTVAAWFSAEMFNPLHGRPIATNMHVMLWEELLLSGYPMMKKKIVNGTWDRLIPNPSHRFVYLGDLSKMESTSKSASNSKGTIGRLWNRIKFLKRAPKNPRGQS